ncbi:M23 family metallopeptidase [Pseudoxanthomonas sp. UTMC 1351]|uniref:M23 family metallopeptidase n=1 Tax=Pseudoxanthomonas sp. UTMC 1351 TaxID=2695853 RepID=UPI0034CF3FA9
MPVNALSPSRPRDNVCMLKAQRQVVPLSVRAIALALMMTAVGVIAEEAWVTWRGVPPAHAGMLGSGGPLIREGVAAAGPGEARLIRSLTLPQPKLCPVEKALVSSTFGRRKDPLGRGWAFHGGIDFAGRIGAPVRAAAAGVIIQADYRRDYGNVIRIAHGDGSVTLYAHNQKLLVREGERVAASQQIASLGSTGRSTGPHLHFEVHLHGRRVDPNPYLTMALPDRINHRPLPATPPCAVRSGLE